MFYIDVLETTVACAFYVFAVLRRECGKLVLKRPLLWCVITEPRYFKLVTVSSFCPFILISVLMPLVLFVIGLEVRAKIQQAIGPHEDLLTIVKRRRLQWYGHVSRSSDLAKTILQGTVKGGRRQGRRRKRWEDNIRRWTGLNFAKSQRAVENWENGGNWLRNHL